MMRRKRGAALTAIFAWIVCASACGQVRFEVVDAGARDAQDAQAADAPPLALECARDPDCPGTPFEALAVDSQANIYGAGHLEAPAPGGGGGGVLPAVVGLPPGTGRIVVLTSVAGLISVLGGSPDQGPDGRDIGSEVFLLGFGGLSSYSARPASALAAVFLTDDEPTDPPPADLNCGDLTYETLSPAPRQVFVAGDGLTGTGTGREQLFFVPDGATRLFFGLADALRDGALPGSYGDNVGAFTVSGEVYAP